MLQCIGEYFVGLIFYVIIAGILYSVGRWIFGHYEI